MQKEQLPVNFAAPLNLTLMMQPATLSLAFAAATDTGCKRANNQDSFGCNHERPFRIGAEPAHRLLHFRDCQGALLEAVG
jgi:hypothetical protein